MKRILQVLIILVLFLPLVHSQSGLEMLSVENGAIGEVKSIIDVRIENRGFDRVFVSIPSDWQLDPIIQGGTSYAVLENSPQAREKYGFRYDKNSLWGSGKSFHSTVTSSKQTINISERWGWWLKPNEGAILHFKVTMTGSGEVDPLKIEKQNPDLVILSWEQEFTLTVATAGRIVAPWSVKDGVLTQSSPAVYGDARKTISISQNYQMDDYGDDFVSEYDVPAWDEWFGLRNPLAYAMEPNLLIDEEMEFTQVEEPAETLIPTWIVSNNKDIRYAYEWKKDTKISGINLFRDDFRNVPMWFQWFS